MKLSEVDLNNLDAFEAGAPHDQFELLRKEAPIHRHAGPSGEEDYWCITKHEDLKMISKDPQLFSSERMSAIMRDPDPESLFPLSLEFETNPFVARGVCGPEQIDNREEFAVFIFDESIAVTILPADAFQFLSPTIGVVAEADGIVVAGD